MPSLSNSNNLNVEITTQANTEGITKTQSSIGGLEEKSKSLTNTFTNLTKSFVFGNVIFSLTSDIAVKAKEVFSDVTKAAQEWQSQQTQLNAALQSTHDASGLTNKDAIDYAESISKSTPITREAALAGENMLLTFTNIHKDVFPQTTKAIADMATAMNHGLTPNAQELSNTAIMVGKALNDPENGLTRLMRVGVAFTQQQKDQIKAMQDAGDVAGAQKIIIGELGTEFGGRASAAADTFRGKLEMLKNKITDLGVDGIGKLNGHLNDLAKWWTVHQVEIQKLVDKIVNFLKPSFEALWNTIELELLPTLKRLWKEVIEPLIPVVGTLFVAAIWLVINAFNLLLEIVMPLINFLLSHKQVVLDFAVAFGILAVAMKFDAITSAFMGNMTAVMGKIGAVKGGVTDLFTKISGGTAMGGIAVVGALADIALVMQAVQTVMGAINAMNNTAKAKTSAAKMYDDSVAKIQHAADAGTISRSAASSRILELGPAPFASGTSFAPGGLSLVGENGPELVSLPRGSSVFTNSQSQAMQGQNTTNNRATNIYGDIHLNSASAVAAFFNKIDRDNILVSKGLSPVRGGN